MEAATEPRLQFAIRPFDTGKARLPILEAHEVHVWHLRLDPSDSCIVRLKDSLSAEELERAARFRFDRHRAEFILARGSLRSLLGAYLAIPPDEVCFQYSEHGKPSVAEVHSPSSLHFNVSHTEGMAIFGFCRGHRIGVDVERLRDDFRADEISERFFSLSERAALNNAPTAQSHELFFRVWTRKEAYIKARGEGLSHHLHQFDVSTDETAILLATRPDTSEAQRWRLQDIKIPSGFVAAAALEVDGARFPAR